MKGVCLSCYQIKTMSKKGLCKSCAEDMGSDDLCVMKNKN
jgi:hypothetical protein